MARAARRGCSCIAIGVAFHARGGGMRAMQRERRVVVVEAGITPVRFIVARRAIHGKACDHVVRLRGGIVVIDMASTASGRCASVSVGVALDAIRCGVRSM